MGTDSLRNPSYHPGNSAVLSKFNEGKDIYLFQKPPQLLINFFLLSFLFWDRFQYILSDAGVSSEQTATGQLPEVGIPCPKTLFCCSSPHKLKCFVLFLFLVSCFFSNLVYDIYRVGVCEFLLFSRKASWRRIWKK